MTARDYRHTIERALQRCGVALTAAEINDLEAQCREGRAALMHRESVDVAHYAVTLPDGQMARLVVDERLWYAITILHFDAPVFRHRVARWKGER